MNLESKPAQAAVSASDPAGREPERLDRPEDAAAEDAVRTLLRWIGEDPDREGLQETPQRLLRAWRHDYFTGYRQDPDAAEEVLSKTFGEVDGYEGPVILSAIAIHSTCEHHLAPIRGHANVAYLPAGRIVGLSKIVRLCDLYARRMQTQERLTSQIAGAIADCLGAKGVAVSIEAEHFCMSSRGVHRPGVITRTECTAGPFPEGTWGRMELLAKVAHGCASGNSSGASS